MLRFTVIGNLGGDAKLHEENGRKFISFNVAHNEKWKDTSGNVRESITWVSCILNGDGGNIVEFLTKGKLVYVEGRGSVRTYHSPKLHQLVAGATINVDKLELLGGPSEDVPRMLIDSQGVVHNVYKAYYLAQDEIVAYHIEKGNAVELFSRDGRRFQCSSEGWISPMVVQEQADAAQETAERENP